MYNQQELNVMLQALLDMNIKGSDAIYMATLQTKINENIQKLIDFYKLRPFLVIPTYNL